MDWIDVTCILHEDMQVFSGQKRFSRTVVSSVETDRCTLSYFCMSSHCGTHLDAPSHFVKGGKSIEQVSLSLLIGDALVHTVSVYQDLLKVPQNTKRVIMRFTEHFRGLTVEDADVLIEKGVSLVGTNRLCIARKDMDTLVHRKLLSRDIWILETLELKGIDDGQYGIICLPLKIADGEGAPARVLLHPKY